MSDDPTQAMGPIDEPTVPAASVEAVGAAGGADGPPTEAMSTVPPDGEPQGNGLRIAIIVLLLLLIGALAYVLLSRGDDDEDDPVDTTTTTSDTTPTTAEADSTTTSQATTTTEPTTTTTAVTPPPSIDSLTASAVACPDPLTLTWTTTNALLVEIAIDNLGGVFDSGPPDGSMDVPAPCGDDTQTYYVTAIGGSGDRSTETLVRP